MTAGPLPQPTTSAGRAGLTALLEDPAGALVAFDFDGTLAPIVEDPAESRAHPAVVPALVRLAARVGTVAVVTGRPAALVVRLGGLDAVPGLVVLGHYGLERWEDGRVTAPDVHPGVAAVRAGVARMDLPEGARVEDKGASVAVHTRQAPDPAAALAAVEEPLRELADACGLAVEPGRFVLELRPPGIDKGHALGELASERAARCVVYAGDDLGDLAAYDAVDALRAAGTPGVLVASSSEEVQALSARADLVVEGPEGVAVLLESLADRLDADGA